MKIKLLGFFIIAVSVLSCAKGTEYNIQESSDDVNMIYSISPFARSASGSFEKTSFSNGDVITVLAKNNKGNKVSVEHRVGDNPLRWSQFSIVQTENDVDFCGVYPKQTIGEDGNFSFDCSASRDVDLLLSDKVTVPFQSKNPVNFNFKHVLHCISINYTFDQDFASESEKTITTSCTFKASATVNVNDGTVTSLGEQKTISKTGTGVSFFVLPQQASEISLTVKCNSMTKTFKLSDINSSNLTTVEKGKKSIVNLTLSKGKITVSGITIHPWENQTTITGTVVLD